MRGGKGYRVTSLIRNCKVTLYYTALCPQKTKEVPYLQQNAQP